MIDLIGSCDTTLTQTGLAQVIVTIQCDLADTIPFGTITRLMS